MLDVELANNPATTLVVGSSANLTFSLLSAPNGTGQSVRSVASVATTAPHTLKIGHSTRTVKGLRLAGNQNPANPIIIDRHLVRVDKVATTPTLQISDPGFQLTYGAQVVIEVPRLGADTPSNQLIMDQLLRIMVALNPSAGAGMARLLNGEV